MRRGTHRGRLTTAALTAPLALAMCFGTASPALAATHATKPPVAPKSKAAKDLLAGVRTKALSDITVYGKRLAVVLQAGAASTVLSSDEVLGLHDAGVLQGVALRDDRVAVVRAKTRKAVAAAAASAAGTVQVATLELGVSVAAETHLAAGDPISATADSLSDDATTAAAAGDDTSDLTDALDDVSVDLESAQGDEATAVSDVMTLDSDATSADVKAAASVSLDDLATIDQDISDATDDLALAQTADSNLSSGDNGDGSDNGDDNGDPSGG